jgi:hypothetical protein
MRWAVAVPSRNRPSHKIKDCRRHLDQALTKDLGWRRHSRWIVRKGRGAGRLERVKRGEFRSGLLTSPVCSGFIVIWVSLWFA